MDGNLQPVHSQVMQADRAEDLFGAKDVVLPAQTLIVYLTREYARLKSVTNPALYSYPEDVEGAQDADEKLDRLFEQAKLRIRQQTYGIEGYGKKKPAYADKSFDIGKNRYYIGQRLAGVGECALYEGFMESRGEILGEVVLKVATGLQQNHLLQREARALHILHQEAVPQWKHLPFLIDRFETGGRLGLVLRKIPGHTLTQVRAHRAHQNGVDQRHMVWMVDRLLSCLGYVHRQGLVHGSLTPEHVIIQSHNHNAIISEWGVSVHKPALTGERVVVISEQYAAPEAIEHGPIGPWSDIYSLGKLMIWLLGGDAANNRLPNTVESALKEFLLRMVREKHTARASDAWELYEEQCRIKDGLWPRKFLHFDMS